MYALRRVALISVVGAVLSFTTPASAQTGPGQALPPTPLRPPVAPPGSLGELPPSAPVVTYEKGLLTISSSNSTLRDILRGIRSQTGAEIEIPPQAEDRVITHLGPGPARDVVQSLLLEVPRFNYIIMGSAADPNALAQVVVFVRQTTGNPSQPLVTTAGVVQQPIFQPTESNIVAQGVQQEYDSQEPPLSVRAQQQQMLQQRQQRIMEEFNRKSE